MRIFMYMNGSAHQVFGEEQMRHEERPSYGDHPHAFRLATGEEIIPPGVPITRPWNGRPEGFKNVTPPADQQKWREKRRARRAAKRERTK